MDVKIEIIKKEVKSVWGGTDFLYTSSFNIKNQGATLKGIFSFTREPISGIAYIKEIISVEEQTSEDVFIINNEEISDILDLQLN